MKLSDTIYRRLVLLNTVFLAAAVVAGTALAWKGRDRIKRRLSSFVESEVVSSRFIQRAVALGLDPDAPHVDVPLYELRISPTNLRKIQTQVAKLVAQGFQADADKIWLPARFYHDGLEYRVKVRLRGDLSNHWKNAKKSWRIRFKNDHLFGGIKELDLTIPVDRAYQTEQVACDMARSLGVMASPGGFCQVRMNGVDMGLYLWAEKYGSHMLEKIGRPTGQIFREANTWPQNYFSGFGLTQHGGRKDAYAYFAASYRPAIYQDSGSAPYAGRWNSFCQLIREADDATFSRQIGRLLDVDKYLKFNAITWLFGSKHCRWGDNLRWYYDDTRGLHEPILADVYRSPIETPVQGSFEAQERSELARRILSIPAFRHQRNEILWKLLNDPAFDAASQSKRYYAGIRSYLLRGVDAMSGPDMDDSFQGTWAILTENRRVIRANLEYARLFVTPQVTNQPSAKNLALQLLPDSLCPLSIDQLTLTFSADLPPNFDAGDCRLQLREEGVVDDSPLTFNAQRLDPRTLQLRIDGARLHARLNDQLRPIAAPWTLQLDGLPKQAALRVVDIKSRNSITNLPLDNYNLFMFPVIDISNPQLKDPAEQSPQATADASGLPFIIRNQQMILPRGDYIVERTLVLPFGYDLVLEPGVILRLRPDVSVLVYGAIQAKGAAEATIRLLPADPTLPWGSLAAVRAKDCSVLRHLTVSGGSETELQGLCLSGQLCFYSSDVQMSDCRILNAHADDGLNVKNADVVIDHCIFADNKFDAFDGDWVQGSVSHSLFENNAGDGIDLSGSQLTVRDCLLTGMGDKAISAGEKTNLITLNNVIRDSAIGIACKDQSQVDLYASVLRRNRLALAAYRKKQLFGGAQLRVVGLLLWGNRRNAEADGESSISLRTLATDSWAPQPNVTASDVRQGLLEKYYQENQHGCVEHRPQSLADSPFSAGPRFTDHDKKQIDFKPAADHPIGLLRPLQLPDFPRGAL